VLKNGKENRKSICLLILEKAYVTRKEMTRYQKA
jgi:hypothetical protein